MPFSDGDRVEMRESCMLHSGKGGARETLKLYDPRSGPLDTSGHPLFQIFTCLVTRVISLHS